MCLVVFYLDYGNQATLAKEELKEMDGADFHDFIGMFILVQVEWLKDIFGLFLHESNRGENCK